MRMRECEYCGMSLEDDEELQPIYVGPLPKPRTILADGIVPKSTTGETVGFQGLQGDIQVLGKPVDEIHAILKAIEESEEMELETVRRVQEPSEKIPGPMWESSSEVVEFRDNAKKVGALIRITPQRDVVEPDMRVCKFCKEKFEQ